MEIEASVVLATYNGEAYLQQQLDSIVGQSIVPMEFIFVDDASTDRTRDIIKSFVNTYGDRYRITTVFRDCNVGYIRNYIDGILQAQGRIIFLCDQDDVWKDNRVEFALRFFSEHSDCIALHSDCDLIDGAGNILAVGIQGYTSMSSRVKLESFVKKVNYPGMAMAFLREAITPGLREVACSDIVLPTHDWLIAYMACKKGGFYLTNEVLTQRRKTGFNVALDVQVERLTTIERRIEGIRLYRQYYSLLESLGETELRVSKYLQVSGNRIKYLQTRSVPGLVANFWNYRYYPSLRALIGDIILVARAGFHEE